MCVSFGFKKVMLDFSECGRISVYPIRRDSKNIGPSTSRQ
jgi:hypothetical protein